MYTLGLTPTTVNFTVRDKDGIGVRHEGPATRLRRGTRNSRSVTAQWTVGPIGYQYMRAFFRTGVKDGSEPFIVKMIFDKPIVTLHRAVFVPGSFRLSATTGYSFVVEAQLEVERKEQ